MRPTYLQLGIPLAAVIFIFAREHVGQDEMVLGLASGSPVHRIEGNAVIQTEERAIGTTNLAALLGLQIRVFHQWLYKACAAKYVP